MPTRKNLSALSSGAPQQPLSRGRGLRLSRAAKQARELATKPSAATDPSALPEPPTPIVTPPPEPARVPTETPTLPAEEDAIVAAPVEPAAVASEPLEPERKERKIQLRKDLLKQAKRIARAQDRKLYQVIEAALEEYIQRHGASE